MAVDLEGTLTALAKLAAGLEALNEQNLKDRVSLLARKSRGVFRKLEKIKALNLCRMAERGELVK